MRHIIVTLLYIFSFCPFIFPVRELGTDIQFYAFILSLLYLGLNLHRISFSPTFNILGVYALLAAITSLLSTSNTIQSINCLFQYLSIFIIGIAIYTLLITENGLNEPLCKILILSWFIVGLIQIFVKPDFLQFIIANFRTSTDRGVCSLASEPSFFGIQCFYFLFIISHFKQHIIYYWIIILAMAFLFAQSFTGLIMIVPITILYLFDQISIRWFRLKYICIGIITILLLSFYIDHYFRAERLEMLTQLAFTKTPYLLDDTSTNVRFSAIINAVNNSYNNDFIPMGFTSRIGSMFGGVIQELGILGFPLTFIICSSIASSFHRKFIKLTAFIILYILFFINMQMANPILAFVIALNIYENNKRL